MAATTTEVIPSGVPPRRRGKGRAPETRQAVVDAVRELLESRRLEDLMVNEIVERAGISRPTFYAHFDTKYSVVAALINSMGEGVFDIWRPVFDGEGPLVEEEVRVAALATILRWRPRAALFMATVEGWHTDNEIHEAWSEVLDRFSAALTARIRRGLDLGPSDDMLATALVSAFERCLYVAVSVPESPLGRSDEELASMLAALWTRSLTA